MHKQHENVHGQRKSNPRVPNVSYIPLAHVGPRVGSEMFRFGSAMTRVGGQAQREPPTRADSHCSGI